jgi:hypothetical protein
MFDPKDEGLRSVFYEGLISGLAGVAVSSHGRSAALRAEPVPVSGLRPAATNAKEK